MTSNTENNPFARFQVLSGSALKVLAAATMLIDHTAGALLSKNPVRLFSIAGRTVTLYMVLRTIGRVAFPVFAFLLTEGFVHTRSRKAYGISLFVFALLSEIPWNLLHTGMLFCPSQNVFFTLFLGFLALCCCERFKENGMLRFGLCIAIVFLAVLARCDYGARGIAIILILYLLREDRAMQTVCGTGILASSYQTLGVAAGFCSLLLYNGKRGFINNRVLKYLFYAIYPVHMLVLYFLKKKYIGY